MIITALFPSNWTGHVHFCSTLWVSRFCGELQDGRQRIDTRGLSVIRMKALQFRDHRRLSLCVSSPLSIYTSVSLLHKCLQLLLVNEVIWRAEATVAEVKPPSACHDLISVSQQKRICRSVLVSTGRSVWETPSLQDAVQLRQLQKTTKKLLITSSLRSVRFFLVLI